MVQVTATMAASKDWESETFDVSTAFRSCKETSRTVYTRAPKKGLPAVDGQKAIKPLGLLEFLKGAYGLAAAPRRWNLRARRLLDKCCFQELRKYRSAFALEDIDGNLRDRVKLHADGGLIFGDPRGKDL